MDDLLTPGYSVRRATLDDFDGVFAVINACDVENYGETDTTEADLRDVWLKFPPHERAVVVVDAEASIAAYAIAIVRSTVQLSGSVFVHPKARDRGIGTWLTHWVEEQSSREVAAAPPDVRVTHEFDTAADDAVALTLLANEGYSLERYFLRMQIDKPDAPPSPVWPEGVTVRTFQVGDERAVHAAHGDSFQDHWGYTPRSFEKWSELMLRGSSFTPDLWFLAMAGDEIAGISLCEDYPEDGFGWVNVLGVRRPWRRTGVGLALLHHSFQEFYRRGRPGVGLGVDASSLTGAVKLYERAGMHMLRRYAANQKELRAGIDITTQTL